MFEEILKKIETCKNSLQEVAVASQIFIDKHESYLEKNVKDSDIIKKKIKDKVVKIYDKS